MVARAILDAAEHPRRSVTVGGVGKVQVLGATLLPTLFDRIAVATQAALVDRSRPVGTRPGNLFAPQGDDGRVEGSQRGRRFSVFTAANRHRGKAIGMAAMLGIAGAWALRKRART